MTNVDRHYFMMYGYITFWAHSKSKGTEELVEKMSTNYWETTTTVYCPLSGTTQVSRYQKKHSPTHHPDHQPIFISFFHLPRSIASSLFKLRAWQSFCTTSLHLLFGLPLGLEPSTWYSIYFFTQSVSVFFSQHMPIPTQPGLSFNSLLGTVFYLHITHPSDHSHLCLLKCHLIFFHDRPGLTSV